jgi:hypothetical protein
MTLQARIGKSIHRGRSSNRESDGRAGADCLWFVHASEIIDQGVVQAALKIGGLIPCIG